MPGGADCGFIAWKFSTTGPWPGISIAPLKPASIAMRGVADHSFEVSWSGGTAGAETIRVELGHRGSSSGAYTSIGVKSVRRDSGTTSVVFEGLPAVGQIKASVRSCKSPVGETGSDPICSAAVEKSVTLAPPVPREPPPVDPGRINPK